MLDLCGGRLPPVGLLLSGSLPSRRPSADAESGTRSRASVCGPSGGFGHCWRLRREKGSWFVGVLPGGRDERFGAHVRCPVSGRLVERQGVQTGARGVVCETWHVLKLVWWIAPPGAHGSRVLARQRLSRRNRRRRWPSPPWDSVTRSAGPWSPSGRTRSRP